MSAQQIYSVQEQFDIAFLKKLPPGLVVTAQGFTTSTGWTNPRLEPRIYVTPPADRIQEFDFVADRPTGIVLWMLTKITGSGILDPLPAWACGVRIIASTNSAERSFYCPRKALVESAAEDDSLEEEAAFAALSAMPGVSVAAPDIDGYELDEIGEEAGIFALPAGRSHSFDLITIANFPEFKTEWQTKCIVKIAGKCRLKTKVPIFYRRTSKIVVEVTASWPTQDDIASAIEDCAKQALAAGIFAGLLTGGFQPAVAAFEAYLAGCLSTKGVDLAGKVKIGMRERKRAGVWKRV
jgi:hypothetical protein